MQKILSSLSKYFIWAVLSCSLLITWNVVQTDAGIFSEVGGMTTDGATTNTIWYSIAQNFQIDHQTDSAQVQKEIQYLVKNQDQFYQILQAAGPYIYFIFKETKTHNLPAEIALIPFIAVLPELGLPIPKMLLFIVIPLVTLLVPAVL